MTRPDFVQAITGELDANLSGLLPDLNPPAISEFLSTPESYAKLVVNFSQRKAAFNQQLNVMVDDMFGGMLRDVTHIISKSQQSSFSNSDTQNALDFNNINHENKIYEIVTQNQELIDPITIDDVDDDASERTTTEIEEQSPKENPNIESLVTSTEANTTQTSSLQVEEQSKSKLSKINKNKAPKFDIKLRKYPKIDHQPIKVEDIVTNKERIIDTRMSLRSSVIKLSPPSESTTFSAIQSEIGHHTAVFKCIYPGCMAGNRNRIFKDEQGRTVFVTFSFENMRRHIIAVHLNQGRNK